MTETEELARLALGGRAMRRRRLSRALLARLIGEREFPVLFHEGERDNVYISIVGQRVILVVIFDERSSLGLVRLRVRKANGELERIFETIQRKVEAEKTRRQEGFDSPFAEITDEDIDSLFRE